MGCVAASVAVVVEGESEIVIWLSHGVFLFVVGPSIDFDCCGSLVWDGGGGGA